MNTLHCGENLIVLNVLFRSLKNHASQVEEDAFEAVWRLGKQAQWEYLELHRVPKLILTATISEGKGCENA